MLPSRERSAKIKIEDETVLQNLMKILLCNINDIDRR